MAPDRILRHLSFTVALASALVLSGCAGPSVDSAAGSVQRGEASYYASRYVGRQTASGERLSAQQLTAAHRSLPFGTRVRVINLDNDRQVTVRINDRGPFTAGRIIDLSPLAARRLHMLQSGTAPVRLEVLAR
ncbi:rare lipoprotein A [Kushneria sinocarnis]|uniref:Endolytic peptidoglycan transglycosylase RlpA n=1 Tax=Kushneria sinocarnis TaxID=595502 RepID=A0A420WTB9_9GAMM|nr:septal ring lytic transglycosylase RlpA family protein [Kushneria sinocarnis]RKQ95785.1 rare lipoprotein A [Kushneria sinocarnis]